MMVSERGLLLYGSPVSIPSTSMLVGSIVQAGAVGVVVVAVVAVVAVVGASSVTVLELLAGGKRK